MTSELPRPAPDLVAFWAREGLFATRFFASPDSIGSEKNDILIHSALDILYCASQKVYKKCCIWEFFVVQQKMQWRSKYKTCPVFEWLQVGQTANGSVVNSV